MKITAEDYDRYLHMARRYTSTDADELLHEVIEILLNRDDYFIKDSLMATCLKNRFLSKKRIKTKFVNIDDVILCNTEEQQPTKEEDNKINHIFKTLEELKSEGKKKQADIFLQSTFAMTQAQVADSYNVSKSTVEKYRKKVKTEIKTRYELDKIKL